MMVIRVKYPLEDVVIHQWVKSHNHLRKISDEFTLPEISTDLLGYQGIIEGRAKYDPSEVRLTFKGDDFQHHIDIVVKCENDDGWRCRIRESDVLKCVERNRPYVYFHNWHSDDTLMMIFFQEELEEMLTTKPQSEEKTMGEAFGGQKYYVVDCRSIDVVLLNTIKSDNPVLGSDYFSHMERLLSEAATGGKE